MSTLSNNTRLTISSTLYLLAASFAAPAFSASFDCAKAATDIEKIICSQPSHDYQDSSSQYADINYLDSQLGERYKSALNSSTAAEKVTLKKDQLRWLKNRNAACNTDKDKKSCLIKWITSRTEKMPVDMSKWDTHNDTQYGFTFKTPHDYFWTAEIVSTPFECAIVDSKEPNKCTDITINNEHYCFQSCSESAAGSIFTNYYYMPDKNKDFAVYLVLNSAQCGAYGSPDEKPYQACDYANKIDKPNMLNKVLSTFEFTKK